MLSSDENSGDDGGLQKSMYSKALPLLSNDPLSQGKCLCCRDETAPIAHSPTTPTSTQDGSCWDCTQGKLHHRSCSLPLNLYQVGHVTCDNASNNNTMLQEFASRVEAGVQRTWIPKKRRIRYVRAKSIIFDAD